jgi:hypothetical protein
MLLQYRQGTGEKLEKYKYYYFNFYLGCEEENNATPMSKFSLLE